MCSDDIELMIDNCRVYDPDGCIECDPGYAVNSNQHACIKLPDNLLIDNCHIHDYSVHRVNTKCITCKEGYRNSGDRLRCVKLSKELKRHKRFQNCRYVSKL